MKIPLVNVLIGARAKPEDDFMALSVYRQGPDATPITELPIIMAQSGAEAVTQVSLAVDERGEQRFLDTTRSDEFDRLAQKFRAAHMNRVYPSEAIPLPTQIEHLGLEPWQFAGREKAKPTLAERRAAAIAELEAIEAVELAAEAQAAAEEAQAALDATPVSEPAPKTKSKAA
jgi:hypothetical protein